jgi:hypothetical protein
LDVTSEARDCVTLEGGGGFVTAALCRDANANETRIELETREWEELVKRFAREVA